MFMFLRYPGFKTKALTLSYDDGSEHDIRMIEILDKYGIKCTFNLISGNMPTDEAQRADFIARYKDTPHEVACHTLNHPQLGHHSLPEIVNQVINDRVNLEKAFGTFVTGMAYPNGYWEKEGMLEALKACGIKYARIVCGSHTFDLPANRLILKDTCHHRDPQLFELLDRFLEIPANIHSIHTKLKMFYLWGHSYEFDGHNEWSILEDFCKKAGGNDDIWYATNGEIFSYLDAYERLERSADGLLVYNPTQTELYFSTFTDNFTIKPGETVRFEK